MTQARSFLDRFHEPISGFTHLGGAILAAVGMVWLITITWDTPSRMVSVIVYGISMILCYSASTALHLPLVTERVRDWLNRLDHASIYIMIAGTYTPFVYNVLTSDGWRWGSLGVIWAIAAIGAAYKLFIYKKETHLSTIGYVAMGWIALLLLPQFLHIMPSVVLWLLAGGGITYSVGAVIFATRWPNFHKHFGFHEVWHLFVLAGSALHFVAVLVILWQ
jgi:hemolysin III